MPEKKRTITDALNELVNNDPNGLKPQINSKAPLNSPALTGTPTAPTPAEGDNSTKLATTAFVNNTVNKITEGLLSFADEDLDTFVELITEFKKLRSAKATSTDFGMVKVGSNITVSEGVISLQKTDVTNALGYEPPQTAGSSISLLGTTGSSTTNGMTQSAITNALNDKLSKTDAANTYLGKSTAATSSTFGAVKIGSNITNSSGTISLTKANVTNALGYTPPETAGTSVTLASGTGTSTTQGMTQKAITAALDDKFDTSTWKNFFSETSGDILTLKNGWLNLGDNSNRICLTSNGVYLVANGTKFEFKSDGIYKGGTKIAG